MSDQALSEAKDKAGRTITVGTVCIYLGGDADEGEDRDTKKGDRVIVRAIHSPNLEFISPRGKKVARPFGAIHLRVDDAIDAPDDKTFGWSAWVCEDQLIAV